MRLELTVYNTLLRILKILLLLLWLPATISQGDTASCYDAKSPPSCVLAIIYEQVSAMQTGAEKETLLIELAIESFLNHDDAIFTKTISQLERINSSLSNSLPVSLKKIALHLSKQAVLPNNKIPSLPALEEMFPTKISRNIIQEELFLHRIKNRNQHITSSIIKHHQNTQLHDSLEWGSLHLFYLLLTRDVSQDNSARLKYKLIQALAKSPQEQHSSQNLSLALMEALGGAIRQSEKTRKKSNINGFSDHELNLLNQRILYYQGFLRYYNQHVGLRSKQCSVPTTAVGSAFNTFFGTENRRLMETLEKLTIENPNDYLISGFIVSHLNHCSPISHFFVHRYLNSVKNIASVKKKIYHLRSYRRYGRT